MPPVDPNFKITEEKQLPRYCYTEFVATKVILLLGAFDAGRGNQFANSFATGASFEPYNGFPGKRYRLRSRSAIATFVRERHARGDGWTALALTAPADARPTGVGIFGLQVRIQTAAAGAFENGVKIVISCATGFVHTWRGPVWSP